MSNVRNDHDEAYVDDPYGEAMSRIATALAQATADRVINSMSVREYQNLEAMKDMMCKVDKAAYDNMADILSNLDAKD